MLDDIVSETAEVEAHTPTRKRTLGAYYTPADVGQLLCKWSIRSHNEHVLEPSFGGCTFLDASIEQLSALGHPTPEKQIFGCDIDPMAFLHLTELLGKSGPADHFFKIDFLALRPEDVGGCIADVVIGNPPYIRHSKIEKKQKLSIAMWKAQYGIHVDARSSLWTYFLLHSLLFLKQGGRLAFVLPGSFLTADYAKNVHRLIAENFERVLAITLTERIFLQAGTEERSVILLADGYQAPTTNKSIKTIHCDTVSELESAIENWDATGLADDELDNNGARSLVPPDARKLFFELGEMLPIKKLASIARVHIGIVTGDTKFFIRNKNDWLNDGITSDFLKFIMPKIKDIPGIELTQEQCQNYIDSGVRCLLLDTTKTPLPTEIDKYLKTFPKKIEEVATFKKRPIWHQPDDKKIPDGFLSFLLHNGPRLILNSAKVNATNSVHRVYFLNEENVETRMLTAISMQSTYTQLHAEIIGRPCGSGALKLEPSEALDLNLILPYNIDPIDLRTTFFEIDAQNRAGDDIKSRTLADKFIEKNLPKGFDKINTKLAKALATSRARRKK